MSLPPLTTVVCLNIPEGWLFGVDLQFFQTTPQFYGIKAIPDGIHVVHWGANQESVRSGHFFAANDQSVVIVRWNSEREEMEIGEEDIGELNVSATKSRIGEYYRFMIQYPESDIWRELVSKIKQTNIDDSLAKVVNSTSTSKEENEILKQSIHESANTRAVNSGTKVEDDKIVKSLIDQPDAIKFLEIDLKKSFKPSELGSDRTQHMLDKTWYLNNIVLEQQSFDYLLGELQLGFLLMLVLANFSGAQQWLKIVELLTHCDKDIEGIPSRYRVFINIVTTQLENCPLEYVDGFLDGERLGKSFSHFLSEQASKRLENVLEKIGINVEEEEDEGPVVVEM